MSAANGTDRVPKLGELPCNVSGSAVTTFSVFFRDSIFALQRRW